MNDFIGIGGGFAVNNAVGEEKHWWDVAIAGIGAAAVSYQAFLRSQNPYGTIGTSTGSCPGGYYLSPSGQCIPLQNYTTTTATNWLPWLLIGGAILAVVLLRK